MILTEDRVNSGYDFASLDAVCDLLTDKDVELIVTDSDDIQILNREYRGIDKPTDVLSFPLEDVPFMPLGTIVINIDKVKEKSEELGHSELDELTLLFVHGLLHLVGYDHETDSGEMRRKEREIIESFNLPKSLILRNS
ncbi:MAG: rRNA maturation RNase YbeY [Sulfurospirillum sp.]|nr:MAG: rRNA maturation RNase YbeY [Sulfurospirillum sp.]